MKTVKIANSVNVDVMIEKVNAEVEFLNNGYEYSDIKNFVLENGSGVYEFVFGSRGGLEDFVKNDKYVSFDEYFADALKEELKFDANVDVEELKENLKEFYSDDEMFLCEDCDFVKCVSYGEESYSLFVNVKV